MKHFFCSRSYFLHGRRGGLAGRRGLRGVRLLAAIAWACALAVPAGAQEQPRVLAAWSQVFGATGAGPVGIAETRTLHGVALWRRSAATLDLPAGWTIQPVWARGEPLAPAAGTPPDCDR
jgi:hypothetical protein